MPELLSPINVVCPPEINLIYHTYLNRTPDIEGATYYTKALQQGRTPTEIESTLANSEEFSQRIDELAKKDPSTAVEILYRTLLKREPDEEGLKVYSQKIALDSRSAPTINALMQSHEFRFQAIALLYVELLERMPDQEGIEKKIESNLSIKSIADEIRSGQEFKSKAKKEKLDDKSALQKIARSFKSADHIIVNLASGPIGDAIVSTAYLNGINNALSKLGRNTQLTIISSGNHQGLLKEYQRLGINVVEAPTDQGISAAQQLIATDTSQNTLILDFATYHGGNPQVSESKIGNTNVTTCLRLIKPGIEVYTKGREGDHRVTTYIEELLSLPPTSLDKMTALPLIPLSEESQKKQIIDNICSRNNLYLDPKSKKLTIAVAASSFSKRYSLDNWAKVIHTLSESVPNLQVFINHFEDNIPGYTRKDVDAMIEREGFGKIIQIFSCNLPELANFVTTQDVVASNDTSVSHLTAAVSGGPKCVTLYQPQGPTPDQWNFSPKQIPAQLSVEDLRRISLSGMNNTSEETKLINYIPAKQVAAQILNAM